MFRGDHIWSKCCCFGPRPWPSALALLAAFWTNKFFWNMSFCHKCPNCFCQFYFASPEIIGVKIYNRQIDRQTNFLIPYTEGSGFFLSVIFTTVLLASLAGGWLLKVGCAWMNFHYSLRVWSSGRFFDRSAHIKIEILLLQAGEPLLIKLSKEIDLQSNKTG